MATAQAAATLSFVALEASLLEQVHALQQQAMRSTWTQDQWHAVLADRYVAIAGLLAQEVITVAVFATVLDEAELETIFVHPSYRRSGVAAKILAQGLAALDKRAIRQLFLEVDADNIAAISLYEKHGFTALERRKAYYKNSEGNGDALIMRRQQQDNL